MHFYSAALAHNPAAVDSFEQSDNPYWVEESGRTKTVYVADVSPIPPSDESQPYANRKRGTGEGPSYTKRGAARDR